MNPSTPVVNNLRERFNRHNQGKVDYTKERLPLTLVTYIAFNDKKNAYQFEKYLKSGSGFAFRNKRLI